MTAWSLLVVSSDQQAETLEHQRAWAEGVAKERAWAIERVFEGVSSGRDGVRGKVRQMIDAVSALPKGRRPARFLMIRTDRLGRDPLEVVALLAEIRKLGVVIHTRADGDLALSKASQALLPMVQSIVAGVENEVRRDKLLAVYRRKRASGLAVGNRRPYGLGIGPDKRDVAIPDQAEFVRLAFDLRAEGTSLYAIALRLAAAPPYRFKAGEKPVHWTAARVKRVLTNRAYIGPVVDEVTFYRAQRDFGSERPARKHPWPLSGSLRCYCGGAMVGSLTVNPRGAPWRYYRCHARWNHDGGYRLVDANVLDAAFHRRLLRLAADPALAEPPAPGISRAMLDRAIATTKADLEQLAKDRREVWDLRARGVVREEDVQERLDLVAGRRDELAANLVQLETERAAYRDRAKRKREHLRELHDAAEAYGSAGPAQQRAFVRAISRAMGGLCCERDGALAFRTVIDPNRQSVAGSHRDFA